MTQPGVVVMLLVFVGAEVLKGFIKKSLFRN